MKIGIIAGSHRQASQSTRVAKYLSQRMSELRISTTCYELDLAANPLPLWDETVWENAEKWQKLWTPIQKELRDCQGFIVISPEWAGMVPAGLKNFFLLTNEKDVGHKPALIVAISSARGGSYPVSELRQSSYKNNKILYIPEHIIIRDVEKMLIGEAILPDDKYIRSRIDFALKLLGSYAQNLVPLRESGLTSHKDYPFGM